MVSIQIKNIDTHTTELGQDVTISECVRAFVNLMVAAGYSKEALTALFQDGDPNSWDDAWKIKED